MGSYNIDNKPRYLSTLLLVLVFELKWWNFFGGNGQQFISKKQKDLPVKSIPFVSKRYEKKSVLDNLESQPNIDN